MSQEVFVFGSNPEGRHGKGAALQARLYHGAIYGQPRGLQGRSYAIVTKELRSWMPKIQLSSIADEVHIFLLFAKEHPSLTFNVSPIGCGLAGFTPADIAPMFRNAPPNVILPPSFKEILA